MGIPLEGHTDRPPLAHTTTMSGPGTKHIELVFLRRRLVEEEVVAGDRLTLFVGKEATDLIALYDVVVGRDTGIHLQHPSTGCAASDAEIQKLQKYAQNIGLTFQIIDDILDITQTAEELGKTAGKDLDAQKVTYPSLWGLEKSKAEAKKLTDEAIASLADYGEGAAPLKALAEYIINRKNGALLSSKHHARPQRRSP